MRQKIKSKIVYKRRCFEIIETRKYDKPIYQAYRLPYYEDGKEFTDLKEAKKYIDNLIKEQEVK